MNNYTLQLVGQKPTPVKIPPIGQNPLGQPPSNSLPGQPPVRKTRSVRIDYGHSTGQ